jgi:tRNA(fMet)-specific endonuclease VapC
VTAHTDLLLLDTNILIHLLRGSPIGRRIESEFRLSDRVHAPLISIVTVGEILAFAQKKGWGPAKIESMQSLLRQLVVVDIHSESVLRSYAEVDSFLTAQGHPIEQNDLWIAATAMAANAHLLTTDKDFDPLAPGHVQRTWIDPAQ